MRPSCPLNSDGVCAQTKGTQRKANVRRPSQKRFIAANSRDAQADSPRDGARNRLLVCPPATASTSRVLETFRGGWCGASTSCISRLSRELQPRSCDIVQSHYFQNPSASEDSSKNP